ncbi:MAG: adenylate/guanylate cyclase domain-containing protein [Dehalococcoidia bacterium]|nr:adenylate/guanylate cyclase domain-containing protein [Dehalococcoidia bacterium]
MSTGLAFIKAWLFLDLRPENEDVVITLPVPHGFTGKELRDALLRGLYRWRERGFADGSFEVDLEGLRLACKVPATTIQQEVKYLRDEGLITSRGTGEADWSTGNFWLTTAGVKHIEAVIESRTGASKYLTRTFMFTDLVGSTELTEQLGDEAARAVMREYDKTTREVVGIYDGQDVKGTGDGLMAAFGSATKAIRCAAAIQQRVQSLADRTLMKLGLKIGINAGDAVEEDEDFYGRAVNIAARLCDSAEASQIRVSRVVVELIGPAEFTTVKLMPIHLKGIVELQEVFLVLWPGQGSAGVGFGVGDTVRHPKFGLGKVRSLTPSGRDHIVVVAFQGEAAIKKLLLSFAPLERVEA